jgi:hypothetical protein
MRAVYRIISGVDLDKFINSHRHCKSFRFEQMYCRPEQTNAIETNKTEI